jgi:hypothetical protein
MIRGFDKLSVKRVNNLKINEEHYRRLERMYQKVPINQFFQPRATIGYGWAELEMQIRPEFYHAAGAVHGSCYFKILDDTAFFAANSLVEDVFLLKLVCKGEAVTSTRNFFIAESKLFDHEGNEIARGSGNFTRSRIKLSPEIGYK